MEELFKNFKEEYSLAMDFYNKGKFSFYFRNIRPALERLCKLVIADQVDGECEPTDLFNGSKRVNSSGKITPGYGSRLQGRQLVTSMFNSFLLKREDVRNAKYDEKLKGLREGMEMYSNCIRCFYSVASAYNHSSDQRAVKAEATKYASILSDFITFLIEASILQEKNLNKLRTLKLVKVVDENDILAITEEKLHISKQYLKQKEEFETACNKIDELKKQNEEALRQSEVSKAEHQRRIQELETIIENLKTAQKVQINSQPIVAPIPRSNQDLELGDEKMDFDQEDVIMAANNQSLLVCGCAGSGKSVIAMKKAKALHNAGADVMTIAYTKSLNDYMQSGVSTDIGKFYYYHQWKNEHCPSADYLIVDEIQDFTEEEIKEFLKATRKHFFFFGDSAQSIYAPFKRGIATMNKIAELAGLEPMMLYTNYRLPRPVAKITQGYVGINVEPYSERTYKNESSILPYIVQCEDSDSQVILIASLIEENINKSIGIFLPDNASVLRFCNQLSTLGISFEHKYELKKASGGQGAYQPYNTLNFTTIVPKVMTYHSAKGLQFDIVILPWYQGTTSDDQKKALYVAMTRTQSQLIITYCDELKSPLKEIPEILYKKVLSN